MDFFSKPIFKTKISLIAAWIISALLDITIFIIMWKKYTWHFILSKTSQNAEKWTLIIITFLLANILLVLWQIIVGDTVTYYNNLKKE